MIPLRLLPNLLLVLGIISLESVVGCLLQMHTYSISTEMPRRRTAVHSAKKAQSIGCWQAAGPVLGRSDWGSPSGPGCQPGSAQQDTQLLAALRYTRHIWVVHIHAWTPVPSAGSPPA